MKLNRIIPFILVLTVSILLSPVLSSRSQAQMPLRLLHDVEVPGEIAQCFPPTPSHLPATYQFDWVGTETDLQAQSNDPKTFYLLDVISPLDEPGDLPWQTLIAVNERGQCFNFIQQNAADVTLTAYAPPDVARKLALQRFQHWIEQEGNVGRERIQRLLFVETPEMFQGMPTSPEPSWISPEDAWALQQLGYQIPNGVNTLPEIRTPYKPSFQ